jgi:hypothetical protein
MKSDGIDAWLKNWLTMQKKGHRPLILKDSSNRPSEAHANTNPTVMDRRKGKKPRAEYIESDNDYEVNNVNDGVSDTAGANTNKETNGESLPKSPHSVVATPKSTGHSLVLFPITRTTRTCYYFLLLRRCVAHYQNMHPLING